MVKTSRQVDENKQVDQGGKDESKRESRKI